MVRISCCALVLVAVALVAGRPVGDAVSQPGPGRSKDLQTRFDSLRVVWGLAPDTASPDWKPLSRDMGLMLRYDERLGLRGRLYVRTDGVWSPVAIDGPEDLHDFVTVR